jgi:hypothetical protein
MLVTTKKAARLRPVNSLRIAAGLWPDKKHAKMPAYGRLKSLQYAGEWRPTAAAGLNCVLLENFSRNSKYFFSRISREFFFSRNGRSLCRPKLRLVKSLQFCWPVIKLCIMLAIYGWRRMVKLNKIGSILSRFSRRRRTITTTTTKQLVDLRCTK